MKQFWTVKWLLLTFLVYIPWPFQAQTTNRDAVHCLIQGNLPSYAEKSLDIYLFSLIRDTSFTIPIDENGLFKYDLSYPYLKSVSLHIDSIKLFSNIVHNDSLQILESKNGLQMKVPDPQRTLVINEAARFFNKWDMKKISSEGDIDDHEAVRQFTGFYNSQLASLLSNDMDPNVAAPIITDIYYSVLSEMQAYKKGLLPTFGLKATIPANYKYKSLLKTPAPYSYKQIDTSLFNNSARYRDFIFYYCTQGSFSLFSTPPSNKDFNESHEQRNFLYVYYLVPTTSVRDWVLFTMLKTYLSNRKFKDFQLGLEHYAKNTGNKQYLNYLQLYYDRIKHLQVGSAALDFTLPDINGRSVSLSDFKGKVVYINFWGVHCGPCISNFKQYYRAIREKYKNVVFLNICVEGSEPDWKSLVKELGLEGINLKADGWTDAAVCKLYDVYSVPDYYVINKAGQIAEVLQPATLYQFLKIAPNYDAFEKY
ncbi:MAG TPA: TlpA disulfide reductase family protein [Chitinophagaceae bacterium]